MTQQRVALRAEIPAPSFRTGSGTKVRVRANSKFSEKIARKICERLMMKESLTEICKDPRMPSMATVARWLADPKLVEFREMYYYSRRIQAELRIDEIFEIADDNTGDWQEQTDKDGNFIKYVPNNEAIQRSRVRIDTRKWYASKMVPRLYGERLDIEHDVTGDLAELLKSATNKDKGLPKPINGEATEVE